MLNSLPTKIGLLLLAIGISFAYGRYSAPKSVETKEVVRKETEYITREVKQPDGTVIKEVIHRDIKETDKQAKTVYEKPKYKVTLIPQYNFDTKKTIYGGSIEKRISGPIFVGLYANTDSVIGATVGMEF